MEVSTTYAEIQRLFPDAIQQVIKAQEKSRSPSAKVHVSELVFAYDFAIRVDGGMTGDEFLKKIQSGELQREAEDKQKKSEEATEIYFRADLLSRMFVRIRANNKRFYAYADLDFDPTMENVPESLASFLEEQWQGHLKDIAERRRIAAMTPEELQKHQEGLLKELSRYPGFHIFKS